jgi:uncharacterized protein (DUF2147 family)
MKNIIIAICLVTLFILPIISYAQKAQPGDAILGTWFNAEKDAKIDIYKVTYKNASYKYSGKVTWLKVPNDENDKPKTDKENPDPKLKTRPRLGLIVLTDLGFKGENKYEKGKIYDPKNGKTYSCQAELDGKILKLRGYIGVSLIGRTSEWTRAQ